MRVREKVSWAAGNAWLFKGSAHTNVIIWILRKTGNRREGRANFLLHMETEVKASDMQ